MDYKYHQIICKLKVLSKLERGEKIIIHGDSIEILDVDGLTWARFRKFWCRANRWKTIARLKNLNQDIHDLNQKLLQAKGLESTSQIKRLASEIQSSLKGIDNLIFTYIDDRSIVSEFEALKENYQVELDLLQPSHDDEQSHSEDSD